MNVFRLVNPGFVDKMIAFDELPARLLHGVRTKELDGFPLYWKRWLKDGGAVRTVKRWNAQELKYEEKQETFTYIIDKLVNQDVEKWQAITNYVRKAVDLSVRLLDKIDDMAIALAKDSHTELSIEPENVPVIPVPVELKEVAEPARIIRPQEVEEKETVVSEVPKRKPGRPRKETVEA